MGSTHIVIRARALRLLALAFPLMAVGAHAQLVLSNGDHVLELTGGVSTYYNQRFLKDGETNRRKDRFRLRDAQIQLEGRYRNSIAYELQFDMADFAQTGSGPIDPENVGLMDAWVTFKGLEFIDITMGYGKLPYGRSSQVPFIYSPYWQRAELVRGDIFSRRDIGVTLSRSFWQQRAAVYAGIYTGLGELSLRGDNDPSGRPEYIGRAEVAWPSRYRKRDIDERLSPVPMFAVGANARYTDKSQPAGGILPAFAGGDYGIKVIDGSRSVVGIDATAQYKGISAQFEMHRMRMEPRNPNSALFRGRPAAEHEGFVLAGGWFGQLNAFSKRFSSILSVRYEELNLNDLAPGVQQRIGGAYAYQFRGFDCMLKIQYWHILEEEASIDPKRWNEQVRLGIQYQFK
jgi:hypothetical protein